MHEGDDSITAGLRRRRDLDRQLEADLASGRRALGLAGAGALASLLAFGVWGPPEVFDQLLQGMCALSSGVGLAYLHRRTRRLAAAEDERERLGELMRAALSPRR